MVRMVVSGAMIMFAGLLMAGLSGYDLGIARASASVRARRFRVSAPRAHLGTGPLAIGAIWLGLILAAAGAAGICWEVPVEPPARWGLLAAAATVALSVGLFTVRKLMKKARISVLDRAVIVRQAPPATVLAAAPVESARHAAGAEVFAAAPVLAGTWAENAQLGWVYKDEAGTLLMVVAAEGDAGKRLVRLTDFRLVAPAELRPPLTLVGAVELAVWPLDPEGGPPEPG